MMEILGELPSGHRKTKRKPAHRIAAENCVPFTLVGGYDFTNLELIWEMSV